MENKPQTPVIAEPDASGETAYLLSSQRNAERLLNSLARSRRVEGAVMTADKLAERVGLDAPRQSRFHYR